MTPDSTVVAHDANQPQKVGRRELMAPGDCLVGSFFGWVSGCNYTTEVRKHNISGYGAAGVSHSQ